jgi:hypothetical protein
MQNPDEMKPAKPVRHWVLWTLVVVFVVASITAMMLADYFFAPGEGGSTTLPKDAADK